MASLVTKAIADIERAKKAARKIKSDYEKNPMVSQEVIDTLAIKTYDNVLNDKADTIERLCEMLEDPDNRYANAMQRLVGIISNKSANIQTKQSYMITIRPDHTKIDFFDFKQHVEQFVTRKCFVEYKYSFEQKGTDPMSLGHGFHVHIVAKMKQRSKSEVLRDTLSSWKEWIDKGFIAANCIDVITSKNGDALVENYLLEYKSDDGHKELTQSWDELWRTGMSLQRLYVSQ